MRRRAKVELGAVVAAAVQSTDFDDFDEAVLDATEWWMRGSGLRRWSLDDVASRADVGRTSIYRRFGDRDAVVHAVLARELRRTLDAIRDAVEEAGDDVESRAVAAVRTALTALDGSVVDALLRSDPDTFLPFLTTDAGPLLAVARAAISAQFVAHGHDPSPELAEAAARFALSFILTRDTVLPLDDPEALDAAIRRMIALFVP